MKRTDCLRLCLCLCLPLLAAGCTRTPATTDGGTEFTAIRITDEVDGLLFTYLLADGSFQTVEHLSDIPAEARGQVIVVDTRLSPEERRSSQILYVADLTEAAHRADGSYPYSLVSRFRFERDLLRDPAAHSGALPAQCADLPPSPEDRVVLYATDWCSVCKAAALFMDQTGIPYQVRDIERDAAAQQELSCKALRAGQHLSGVPVLEVAGTLLLGFDRDRLVELSRRLKPSADKPPAPPPPAPAPTQSL